MCCGDCIDWFVTVLRPAPERDLMTHDSCLCSKWLLFATVADKRAMCWRLPAMKWEMLWVCLYGGWFFFFFFCTKHNSAALWSTAHGWALWARPIRRGIFLFGHLWDGWKGKCGRCTAPYGEAQRCKTTIKHHPSTCKLQNSCWQNHTGTSISTAGVQRFSNPRAVLTGLAAI